ncbi:MAG: hypothetical protein H7A51_14930 [Akkermansiaceae bacterium]|nr:hypothetical protein [Akkermansiaceae bacterium]
MCAGKERGRRGFALVATISVMVLLVMIALAMLSLSAIELRSRGSQEAEMTARANARLALMLAIGQLQSELGPDRRISARADILAQDASTLKNAHFTGVWDSRQDLTDTGNLTLPADYDKDQSFRAWLVSGAWELGKNDAATVDLTSSGVRLLGEGTCPDPSDWVYAPDVKTEGGAMAWWTSGNAVKCRVNAGHREDVTKPGALLTRAHAMDGATQGQNQVDDTLPTSREEWDKSITLPTLGLTSTGSGSGTAADDKFHDIATTGESLLVDASRGGLRKCLNLAMESSATPPEYTLENYIPWEYLRHYCRLYRLSDGTGAPIVRLDSSGRPMVKSGSDHENVHADANPAATDKRLRLSPVVVKCMMLISYSTQKYSGSSAALDKYGLHFSLYPVVVLWNPYNVALEIDSLTVATEKLPLNFDVRINGASVYNFDWRAKSTTSWWSTSQSRGNVSENLKEHATIPAGGNMVLYYNSGGKASQTGEHYLGQFAYKNFDYGPNLPGATYRNLRANGRSLYQNGVQSQEIIGQKSDKVQVVIDCDTYGDSSSNYKRQYAWDIHAQSYYLSTSQNWGIWNNEFNSKQFSAFVIEKTSPNVKLVSAAEAPSYTFGALEDNPTAFALFEYHVKSADGEQFPQKHWVQSLPAHQFNSITRSDWSGGDLVTPWYAQSVAFDVRTINSVNEAWQLLNVSPVDQNSAFIGPSYTAAEGQERVTSQSIPLAPLHSLGQLQHLPVYDNSSFDERPLEVGQNHAIGNSFANPGVPAQAVTHAGWDHWWKMFGYSAGQGFGSLSKRSHEVRDYSYLANAHLFDGWYFSSIAHQDSALSKSEGSDLSLRQVAEDFLVNGKSLPNPRYALASGVSGQDVMTSLFPGNQPASDAYRKLAADLVVQGGFNVNSTSVQAWELLLSGLYQRPTVVADPNGNGRATTTSATTGRYVVSRFPMANAGAYDGGGNEPEAWSGYRELSDDDIHKLAQSIVKQVRRYGPFRSLSEFVNRRLEYGSELSLRGPLAEALESDDTSINKDLQDWGEITKNTIKDCQYPYMDAALGPLLQGAPGYVTQADLLQGLAPVMTVRSDSFTVRAYGEARDNAGKVLARAWCEATVQRATDYLDPADAAWTELGNLQSQVNKNFGRRLHITGFRWLSKDSV